jgi:hypothetical protein
MEDQENQAIVQGEPNGEQNVNFILGLPAQENPIPGGFFLPHDLLQDISNAGPNDNNPSSPQINLNIQVGFMFNHDTLMVDPIMEKFTMQMEPLSQPTFSADLYRLWGTYFSLVGNPEK